MKHLIPEFERIKARYPAGRESSLVLPCLRRIQEDRGFVADSDVDDLVAWLGVPRIQVEEVLSYYTQFRRKPIGRWHVQACRNVSCSMRGAERMIDHLARCRAVAFVPWNEDYGFVTVEAFMCGKPVLTVSDSGGPSELVQDGVSGYVTAPTSEALAVGLREIMSDRTRAIRMGEAGAVTAHAMTWAGAVDQLLR